jgi:hypothetical protein
LRVPHRWATAVCSASLERDGKTPKDISRNSGQNRVDVKAALSTTSSSHARNFQKIGSAVERQGSITRERFKRGSRCYNATILDQKVHVGVEAFHPKDFILCFLRNISEIHNLDKTQLAVWRLFV